jgi:hypothetical protein
MGWGRCGDTGLESLGAKIPGVGGFGRGAGQGTCNAAKTLLGTKSYGRKSVGVGGFGRTQMNM